MNYEVFISYTEKDLKSAQRLYNDLKSAGFEPWLDEKNILAGQATKSVINRAIKNSSYFLALLSSNSVSEKGYVHKELKIALEIFDENPANTIFIIPVRIDNCKVSDENLYKFQCVDLFSSYEKGLEKIIHALKNSNDTPEIFTEKDTNFSDGAQKATSDSGQKRPKLNKFHSNMCNRNRQVNDFRQFFQTKCKEYPNHPQFFFIHGNELEGHESFITRLKETLIKKYAEEEWGEHADVPLNNVPWPERGNFEIRKRDLEMNLIESFYEYHNNYSVDALCELARRKKHSLVMVKHNIFASKWDKQDEQLTLWYINEYWEQLVYKENIPQFLNIFDIRYPLESQSGWLKRLIWNCYYKKRIRSQLSRILRAVKESCPCVLIKELGPVTIEHVTDWFIHYEIYETEEIKSIFKENDKPVKFKCMVKVEERLREIIEKYEKETLWQD
ncbi:MAG: toll/interleukin-1 receptor domain-containing protein [Desulfobacterales bacterium]|nr:toll/interleukin-1 receptor domain-containing protein [Desulfobacterales bacterium]